MHVTKQSNDWLVVWPPSQRCRHCDVKCLHLGEENLAGNQKVPFQLRQSKNAKNRDELRQFVFSPVSRAETTLPLRETSLKAFDYFIEAFHFFLQSYIKHTLFICELFAVASESRLKPTFFDLPSHPCFGRRHFWCVLGIFSPLLLAPRCISAPPLLTQQILSRFNPRTQTEKWTWIETSVPAFNPRRLI